MPQKPRGGREGGKKASGRARRVYTAHRYPGLALFMR